MSILKILLFLTISTVAWAQNSVYRCERDGRVLYTQFPEEGQDCTPLALQVIELSPEDEERLDREAARREELARQRREDEFMERLVQARQYEALAARREAASQAVQTQLMLELLDARWRDREWRDQFLFLSPGTRRFHRGKRPSPPPPPQRPGSLLNPPLHGGSLLNPPVHRGTLLNPPPRTGPSGRSDRR